MKKRKTISDRHMAVVNHYFACDFRKREAVVRAGFHREGASDRIFKRPDVIREIEKRRAALAKKHEVTREWLIERYKRIVQTGDAMAKYKKVSEDGAVYWDFTDLTPEDAALIRGIKTKYYVEGRGDDAREVKEFTPDIGSTGDEKAALDSLARMIGAFEDKTKLEAGEELLALLNAGRNRVKKSDDPEKN